MSIFKNNFVIGLTAGLTATVLGPVLMPALRRGARPLAKSAIRGGMLLYQKGREAVAHSGEAVEDILAELHAEEESRQVTGGSMTPQGEGGSHLSAVKTPAEADPKRATDTKPS